LGDSTICRFLERLPTWGLHQPPVVRLGSIPIMGNGILLRAPLAAALIAAVPMLTACGGGTIKDEADVVAGKQAFVAKCGACHTLARAQTKGTTGPNLDEAFQQSYKEGFGTSAIRGVVYKQILHPGRSSGMPPKLVTGERARDVAAYVAQSVARGGKDTGRLATAVKAAGGGTATEKNGVISIPADPGGQLRYTADKATGSPGPVTIQMPNKSGIPHDITIDGLGQGKIVTKGVSSFKAKLEAGKTYTYYCSVPGHRQAGMQGTLTVK
jgi:mono/diheme cytochrome c family protein